MSRHPLVARSRDPRVRQARGFREAAAELTGEILAAEFEAEREGAPRRSEAKKKHLVQPNQRLAAERHPDRDDEHAAIALVARREKGGEGIRLPEEEGFFDALHAGLVLKSAPADPKLGEEDPNFGIDRIDLVGIGPSDRLALVVCVEVVRPFILGERPPAGEEVARTLNTPVRLVNEILYELSSQGILRSVTLTDRKGAQRDLSDDEIEHAIQEIQSTIQKYRK